MRKFLSYKLKPQDAELRYRNGRFTHDRTHVMGIIVVTAFIVAGYIALDTFFIQDRNALKISIVARSLTLAASILTIWLIYRISSIKLFDWTVFIWGIFLISHMLTINLVRPGDNVNIVAWDILAILVIYTVFPVPLHFQVIVSSLLTMGSGMLWLIYKDPQWRVLGLVSTLSAYFSANFYGIFLSIRLRRTNRKQFIFFEEEQKAKEKLETTLAEVKILRGILPICSFCKKIRNDKGYYEAVEAYIHRYSEADFTHTVCPECLAEHYPEFQRKSNTQS